VQTKLRPFVVTGAISASLVHVSVAGAQAVRTEVLRAKGFAESKVAVFECGLSLQSSKMQKQIRPRGILVVLHGRGGANGVSGLIETFRPSVCRHNLVAVAPSAPTSNRNWPFETSNGEGQDQFLLNFIRKEVRQLLRLSASEDSLPIYLVGISAGATFLMGDFYPQHGHKLRGRAIALCGGSWPVNGKINGIKSIESAFPLYVQIGKSDFLFGQVKAGLTKYSELGLPLRARFTEAAGHCAFDFNEALDLVLSEQK
jgi:predicted esterase